MPPGTQKNSRLAEVIRSIRKRTGKTQVMFAKDLTVTHVTVSRYESGELTPGHYPLLVLFGRAESGHEKHVISQALRAVLGLKKTPSEETIREGIAMTAKAMGELAKIAAQTPVETRAHRFVNQALVIANAAQSSPEDYPSDTIIDMLSLWWQHEEDPEAASVFQSALGYIEVQLHASQPKGKKKA